LENKRLHIKQGVGHNVFLKQKPASIQQRAKCLTSEVKHAAILQVENAAGCWQLRA